MKNKTKTINHQETVESEQINTSINDRSLSLVLSLRINDQFLLQKQTVDEQRYENNHRSNCDVLSTTDYQLSIDDRNRIYDMFMKGLLGIEEHEKTLVKCPNPNNLFQLEISSNKIDNKDQPTKIPTSRAFSLTRSLVNKPDTLYKIPDILPHLLSNDNHSISTSANGRLSLNEHISNLQDTSSSITQSASSTKSNSTTDEACTLHKFVELEKLEDTIPISAKQLEIIERKRHRYKLQREIITIAKQALKPAFKKHDITKDDYKIIMKKVVTKGTYSNRVDRKWIDKTINSYVKKYRSVHLHHLTEML